MSEADHEQQVDAVDPMVDRALRLFTFLGAAARLKNTPVRSVDTYQSTLWFSDIPVHSAVQSAHRDGDPVPEAPILAVDRVPRLAPPEVPAELAPWLDGPRDDVDHPPSLYDTITVASENPQDLRPDEDDEHEAGTGASVQLLIDDHPDVRQAFDRWMDAWQNWSATERHHEEIREFYRRLFTIQVAASGNAEEFELVLGLACLGWLPEGHPAVKRHLLTVPIAIRLDDRSGRLTVERTEAPESLKVEVDMLDPSLVNARYVGEVRSRAQQHEEHPLHRDAVGALARSLVHTMDPDAVYDDTDHQPVVGPRPAAAFAPAIILRKRSQQGIVDIFESIVTQLSATDRVPDGILPLIDPDHRPAASADRTDGAVVHVDDEQFLPLPVNDVQRRIISHVDTRAQTLVQGPPGTGKTHTAVALLTHLLAQGKRVLVTAYTDRALREVRDKLPAAFKPLSVSVVGTSREDMADLKVAVERIAATAADHDPKRSADAIASHLGKIDDLRRRRATLHRQLIDSRANDVAEFSVGGYHGTQAAIAQQHSELATQLGWLAEFVQISSGTSAPLTDAEVATFRAHLLDTERAADEPEASQRLLDETATPAPETIAQLIANEDNARSHNEQYRQHRTHPGFANVARLPVSSRRELQRNLHRLADELEALSRRTETWMPQALIDLRSGRSGIWASRAQTIQQLIDSGAAPLASLGHLNDVTVTAADIGPLVAQATAVLAYLADGKTVKTNADGTPKLGVLAPQAVKQAMPLFEHVRVNGVTPTTAGQLAAFLRWTEAHRAVTALDRAWPANTVIPAEDTLQERLQWHRTELEQLRKAQALGLNVELEDRRLAQAGLARPDWNDVTSIRAYAALADAALAADELTAATDALSQIATRFGQVAQWTDAAPTVHQALLAIRSRDVNEYGAAFGRLQRLRQVRREAARHEEMSSRLTQAAPALYHAIVEQPDDEQWTDRLATFSRAWEWAQTRAWLLDGERTDVNALQAEVQQIEQHIHKIVEQLAAERAWNHAVSASRLSGRSRANLEQYAYLVRRLGKGTGKYAHLQRAEIRQAMDKCRPSVPVWIMPIYRIAEQLEIHPNMFDVVIVDEASQAGLEATFLQYLAPKIVVIGDDKQISPTAVGVNQMQLRALAGQYIADDPYRSSWQDPQRSLFDEARMRFSGLLTLVEHRRCVPEIIGFSNRIAYEPDGIRLIPVRQYGADRLEPIKPVHVRDGYVRGTTNKINPAEVDAVVDQIEKCIADPRYDGLTFGVISLLGKPQAAAIEKQLLERITPAEWKARDLRCGDSADFQGSERDVVFLSMVVAIEPGRPLMSLTRDDYVKRYNVAASRAKDQMWLFHSIALSDVGNPEDMRFQLLDYCYGVAKRPIGGSETAISSGAPHDRLVTPFDSLFEQRVYNRLIDRGYTVWPQHQVDSYRIDLVVIGNKARLAVECDGDTWHGPDVYERDLARQRNLERCGWQFFRIRESAFYVDEPSALAGLWESLRELDIYPSGWSASRAEDSPTPAELSPVRDPDEGSPTGQPVGPYAPNPNGIDVQATEEDEPDWESALWREEEASSTEDIIEMRDVHAESGIDQQKSTPLAQPSTLPAYDAFEGLVPSALEASKQQLIDGILAIVAVEGPVIGDRIHTAYVRASGGQRVGKQIAHALNSAITLAVRRGQLLEDNPLNEPGIKPRTYRLSQQPNVRVRRLGPRSLEDVPPAEVAAHLSQAAEICDPDDVEELFRTALSELGLKRLTKNAADRLTDCLRLATRRAS